MAFVPYCYDVGRKLLIFNGGYGLASPGMGRPPQKYNISVSPLVPCVSNYKKVSVHPINFIKNILLSDIMALVSMLESLDDAQKQEWDKLNAFITQTPELTSLLYDLDLLPEQIVSDAAFIRMILIAEHFRVMHDRLTKS